MGNRSQILVAPKACVVRRLRSKDIPDIKRILGKTAVFNSREKREIVGLARDFFENPRGDEFRTLVCTVERGIAGFICFGSDVGFGTYEISFLYVAPEYQRNGVATTLIKAVEKYAREKSGRMIFLYTSGSGEYLPAQKLYRKAGYSRSAVIKDFFEDGDSKIIYSKRLRKARVSPRPSGCR